MRFVFTVNGWGVGGFATFCRNLSLGLRQRGHEVMLLVLPEVEPEAEVPRGLFDRCVVLPRALGRLGPHLGRVAQVIAELQPEVLVLNDSPYAMAALPFLPRAIVRLPVLHSLAPDEQQLALSYAWWWDRLLAVSEGVAEEARAWARPRSERTGEQLNRPLARSSRHPSFEVEPKGMPGARAEAEDLGSRLCVCALGVPLAQPSQRPLGAHEPLHLISVGRVVVYQKRWDRVPAIAWELANRDVNFHWTVLGDGAYLGELCRELQRLGLAGRFGFRGTVAPAAVSEALARADVFVLTSDCEGMPQAMLEAMAQGVVPVVSRIPGSTTCLVAEGEDGFLCEPAYPGAFAMRIAELAHDRRRCAELGRQAATRVAEHFSLEAFAERFLALVAAVPREPESRPVQLPAVRCLLDQPAYRCLGFWRSLRHQSLGQLKRWVLAKQKQAQFKWGTASGLAGSPAMQARSRQGGGI